MTAREAAGAPPFDPMTFRHVVDHLASGVTLVTTRTADGDFGMAASSVTSLSVDPPMMLACLRNSSPTSAVSAAGVLRGERPR